MANPPTWNVTGLLDYFREVDATEDRRFAFILGAGASVQSGIKMAGALVDRWLHELHAREDLQRRPLAEWATAENLGIPGFVYARAVESYSEVFARRFARRLDEGFAYLERELDDKEPSFGYSVLAQILANTRHRVVITTNFDNLVADALAIYTRQLPFVCGHEALAGFVRANPRRPLVVKIHRDLLLGPKNRSDEIAALPDPLVASLRALLAGHTPIVIGYGGNDGSLMGLLRETLQPGDIPFGIYWTYWKGGGPPNDAIVEVVRRHDGALIPIDGFDELMLELNGVVGYPLMDQRIVKRAEERAQTYRKNFEALHRRVFPPAESLELEAEDESVDEAEPVSFAAPVVHEAATSALHSDDFAAAPAERDRGGEPGSRREPAAAPVMRGLEPERAASETRRPRTPPPLGPVLPARSSPTRSAGPPEPPPAPQSVTTTPTPSAASRPADDKPPPPREAIVVPQTSLQAATQALVSASTDETDWWTLKLEADRQPTSIRRIIAYQEARERFPDQPEVLQGLARELALLGRSGEARALYARLEQLIPDDPLLHLDLAVFYVHWGVGRTQSEPRAARAWRLALVHAPETSTLAAIAFVRGLLARREDRDDIAALRVLRGLLPARAPALLPLVPVLTRIIRKRLDEPSQALYYRLLACLRGETDPQTLEAIARWNQLTLLDPSAAWPNDAPVLQDS